MIKFVTHQLEVRQMLKKNKLRIEIKYQKLLYKVLECNTTQVMYSRNLYFP